MNIGFTGTRHGMTPRQLAALDAELRRHSSGALHHGDCIGADEQACGLAKGLAIPTVCHPPKNPKLRAFTKNTVTLPEQGYLARNRDIVDASEMLIAAPSSETEEITSGTWYTIRYARKRQKPILILSPAGEVFDRRVEIREAK